MTARRRRKSGSGPSATALIAWVGGAQTGVGASPSASVSMIDSGPSARVPSGRAILVGRACGLAAGTLLASGSVLASATGVGDGSPPGGSGSPLDHTPTTPGISSGIQDEARVTAPAERVSAAPDLVSTQAVAETSPVPHPRLGQVRRNSLASLDALAEPSRQTSTAPRPWDSPPSETGHAPTGPFAPVSPVLDPAAKGIDRVGGVLAPTNAGEERAGSLRDEKTARSQDDPTGLSAINAVTPVTETVAPVTQAVAPATRAVAPITRTVTEAVAPRAGHATRPAMAMLTSLLPIR